MLKLKKFLQLYKQKFILLRIYIIANISMSNALMSRKTTIELRHLIIDGYLGGEGGKGEGLYIDNQWMCANNNTVYGLILKVIHVKCSMNDVKQRIPKTVLCKLANYENWEVKQDGNDTITILQLAKKKSKRNIVCRMYQTLKVQDKDTSAVITSNLPRLMIGLTVEKNQIRSNRY